ncbi:M3 family oligoendopeptidase [Fusibacter sp. 3D3]|uniref:M3 family oligoendopeptidase n=1 Tax=Fusibacter sp. 3D3 TaxID=1048380 RepID=UPI000853B433|nr:M3 family oligoendopeptidase [Fusibacter sp. 3D3]GAU76181.1 oligoendopeptidase F [Fusibacter sp. 3D3]
MNYNWSLNALYTDFDSADFKKDFNALEMELEALNKAAQSLKDGESLEIYFRHYESFNILVAKLYSYCNLTFSVNTKHEKALQYSDKILTLYNNATLAKAKCVHFLNQIEAIDAVIQHSEYLSSLSFIIMRLKASGTHMLSESEEVIASKLSQTGSNAWSTLQSKLTSTLTATLILEDKTEVLPIATLRNLAKDSDPKVRKAAYEAELLAYSKIDEAIALSLNSIKGEVITMSELRGYASPLDKTLEDSRMSKKSLDAMFSAIQKYIPEFQKYLVAKGKFLNHQNGLPFYDLFAPVGTQCKKYTYEEGCEFVLTNFKQFSDRLYQVAKDAMDKSWIDVEPKDGKVNGAFCSDQHPIKEFRVMLNYTGNLGDVTTLAHELGHGYHVMCTLDENILNTDAPMPLAETASTFCETIVNNAALEIASKEEAITILENALQDATQVICDIYSRFLFESALFDTRVDHPLSVAEFKEAMLNAQKEAYGAGLDHDYLHPYMWLIKPHYYSADLNFYNFPYAFGLLFAKGLYAKYLEDKTYFVEHYDQLLASAGKMAIVDVCKLMDIDVESEAFWIKSLEIIKKDIVLFESLIQKSYPQ